MEIKQLEYVIRAAEMGSFNKASEYLYTTQSNVSKVIRSLEEELGYKIFRRNGGGVILTDAGKILYDQSQQIMKMLGRFAALSELEEKTCFHMASVSSNFIAKKFALFTAMHDSHDYCLKYWEGSLSKVVELVEQGEAELGFLYIGQRQRDSFKAMLEKRGLYFQEVFDARAVLCVGPGHPLAGEKVVTADMMRDLHFVRYKEDGLSRTYHLQQLEKDLKLERAMDHAVEIDSDYALINLLTLTDCAYLCYGGLQREEAGIKDIRSIPVDYDKETVCLGFIHRKSEELTLISEQFLRTLS